MLPLSIFSFKTLGRPKEIPKGLLLALGLLLSLEFGVARSDWLWHTIPRSSTGIVDALERGVIAPAPDPVVVLLGNSRLRDAVAPRVLEERLGLTKGTVLNLALTGGVPFDSLVMYRRNRQKLSRAKVLVLDFEPYYFKQSVGLSGRVQRFASLEERVRLFWGKRELAPSLVGYFWRTYGIRASLNGWRKNWFTRPERVAVGEDGRVVWRTLDDLDASGQRDDSAQRVEDWYGHPRRSFEHRDQLLRLIGLARDDGLRIVMLRLPAKDYFVDVARALCHEEYAACTNELASLAFAADASFCYESARDLGIDDSSFYDYGHTTPRGAKAISEKIGNMLKCEYVFEEERMGSPVQRIASRKPPAR